MKENFNDEEAQTLKNFPSANEFIKLIGDNNFLLTEIERNNW